MRRRRTGGVAARRLGVGCLAASLLALGLGGCVSPRNGLGTNSSQCFRALAVARADVGKKATFAGVRYLTASQLKGDLKRSRSHTLAGLPAANHPICLVAYRGSFSVASVKNPWPPGRKTGKLALVAVQQSNEHVVLTILLTRAPLRLTREFPLTR